MDVFENKKLAAVGLALAVLPSCTRTRGLSEVNYARIKAAESITQDANEAVAKFYASDYGDIPATYESLQAYLDRAIELRSDEMELLIELREELVADMPSEDGQ